MMIFDTIINIFLLPVKSLLMFMPTISITIPEEAVGFVSKTILMVGYFLPVSTILAILYLKFKIWTFRFVLNLICKSKSFIPFMGGF